MIAPTLIDYQETAWNTTGASKSVTISWQPGDFIVAIAGEESASIPGTPSGTGLTFSTVKSNNAASTCASRLCVCQPQTSGSSITVSCSDGSGGADHWGFAVWVFRNSLGGGNSAEQHSSTQTVAMTPSSANCAVVWAVFDFGAGAAPTITPTPSNTRENTQDAGRYTISVADLTDQSSGGSTSYGLSGAATGPYSILVMEIMSAADGRGGSPFDDRFRFGNPALLSHTSTLGTQRNPWSDDACDLGWRDAVTDNRSRML